MSDQGAHRVPLRSLLGLPGVAPPPPPPDPDRIRAEGHAVGLAEGRAEAAAALAEAAAAWRAERTALEASAAALLDAVAADLAGLVLAIAEAVLAAEPRSRPETIAALIREALAAVPAEAKGILLFGPETRLPDALPPGWDSGTDPRLAPGDVLALLPPRGFHAAIDRRLQRVAEALGGAS